MLQASVDRFGWTVAGPEPVEVGQHVSGSLARGAAKLGDLDERPGDAGAERLDQLDHQLAARGWVGVPVGGDHPLVDAPGGLDLDVLIDGEQSRESGGLLVGEQVMPVNLRELHRIMVGTPAACIRPTPCASPR